MLRIFLDDCLFVCKYCTLFNDKCTMLKPDKLIYCLKYVMFLCLEIVFIASVNPEVQLLGLI